MARISGVNLPNKPVAIALTYIFGIGRTTAVNICEQANVTGTLRANDLGDDEISRIREIIDRDIEVEGDLRRQTEPLEDQRDQQRVHQLPPAPTPAARSWCRCARPSIR